MVYTTESSLCSKLLKNKVLYPFLGFLLLCNTAKSQTSGWQLIDSLGITEATNVTQDGIRHIYWSTVEGNLYKYNYRLEAQQEFSAPYLSELTSLEASQMLKVFTFYQNSQQFQFFDRFLTPTSRATIESEDLTHFSVATLSSDQKIWLFDNNSVQIVKYNPILEAIEQRIDTRYFLPEEASIKAIKEYKNRLYLWYNKEVIVFDFLGNLIKKLPIVVDASSFHFYQDHLYFVKNKEMHSFHLASLEQKKYVLPVDREVLHAIILDKKVFLFTKSKLYTLLGEL